MRSADIQSAFNYQPLPRYKPTEIKRVVHVELHEKARKFALALNDIIPDAPDKEEVIALLREVVRRADAIIAANPEDPPGYRKG